MSSPPVSAIPESVVFPLGGLHLGDLLMALPAIAAARRFATPVVSGLQPRHFAAVSALPLLFRQNGPPAARTLLPVWRTGQHRTDGWLATLGAGVEPERMAIPVRGLAQAHGALPGPGWALLSPWADHPPKRWHAQGWRQVAGHLRGRGYRIALIGPRPSAALVSQICAAEDRVLVGMDSPTTWPALLTRADIVVSPDTGCVHMADALGVPVVGLYGPTSAAEYGPYWQRDFCASAPDMASLRADTVCERIDGLLSGLGRQRQNRAAP
ncbi:glycosyltransferase family 9 protein [Stenotrophomonas maltophilia]|nr:glycosyltransferase family 9 protein [Stenotrophomonas maltophilia]